MPGSDRLEESSTSEVPEGENTVSEAATTPDTEAVPEASEVDVTPVDVTPVDVTPVDVTPEAKAPPARSPRTRRPRAASAEAPEVDAQVPEASAAEAAAPRPRRAPRRRSAAQEEAPAEAPPTVKRVPRLLEQYRSRVKESLREEFGYRNVMQVPRIEKVVLNIGLGETKTNPKAMESATRDLALISAQKPITTRARRSIAGFKLREGDPIGTAVTLRGNRMYEFMDRLLNAALPRIRDFRGVSRRAFDGRGNYSLGIREQVIFPEIDYGQIDRIRSLQVSIITTASTDQEAMRLLDLLGMPFTREEVANRGNGNA